MTRFSGFLWFLLFVLWGFMGELVCKASCCAVLLSVNALVESPAVKASNDGWVWVIKPLVMDVTGE